MRLQYNTKAEYGFERILTLTEKWFVENKKADFISLGNKLGLDPVTIRLLVNRGASSEEEIRDYLFSDKNDLHDPALMKDVEKAADFIAHIRSEGKSVVIASDYDVDGIFSGELLYEALCMLGIDANVKTPDRVSEGYGLNARIINEAVQEGAGLLITCDNGISSFDAALLAKEKGLPLIITDHHEIPFDEEDGERTYRVPEALAVINPKQPSCGYPFKGLCGCGVAFKLVSYIFEKEGLTIPDVFYEYAAIATIADVMDLTGENRIIVKEGLKTISRTKNKGLSSLISCCSIEDKAISAYHIGFILGPCFNAAGRLSTVDIAYDLLREKDQKKAVGYAEALRALNEKRKLMTEEGAAQAMSIIEERALDKNKIILVRLHGCHESIVGIIAGRLKEKYNKPSLVFTDAGDCLKGSGRSIDGYHMYEALCECRDLLERFGGHALAAGLSIAPDSFEPLSACLNKNCTLSDEDMQPKVTIDMPMPLGYINEKLIDELSLLEPVGKSNPRPVFAEKNLSVLGAVLIGKNKNILKLRVGNKAGAEMDALLFRDAENFINEATAAYGAGEWEKALSRRKNLIDLSVCYYPSVNEYMGVKTLQITISHYRFNTSSENRS